MQMPMQAMQGGEGPSGKGQRLRTSREHFFYFIYMLKIIIIFAVVLCFIFVINWIFE
jgi:hypothetical protein